MKNTAIIYVCLFLASAMFGMEKDVYQAGILTIHPDKVTKIARSKTSYLHNLFTPITPAYPKMGMFNKLQKFVMHNHMNQAFESAGHDPEKAEALLQNNMIRELEEKKYKDLLQEYRETTSRTSSHAKRSIFGLAAHLGVIAGSTYMAFFYNQFSYLNSFLNPEYIRAFSIGTGLASAAHLATFCKNAYTTHASLSHQSKACAQRVADQRKACNRFIDEHFPGTKHLR